MRFHLTSLDRAKSVTRNLIGLVAHHRLELSQTDARHMLAGMLGYRDWAELKIVTERHDRTPTPFDETLRPEALRDRLVHQAEMLAAASGIPEEACVRIVASLRATAHPAGPHRLFGPSSLPPPWAVEYRGVVGGASVLEGFRLDRGNPWNAVDPLLPEPPAVGAPDVFAEIVLSELDFEYPHGDQWKVRAAAMMTGVALALAWKRDHCGLDLRWKTVWDHLRLAAMLDLADPAKEPDMPDLIRFLIESYLALLPGYRKEDGAMQRQTTLDQHGYLQMQTTMVVGRLGHGIRGRPADVAPRPAYDPAEWTTVTGPSGTSWTFRRPKTPA